MAFAIVELLAENRELSPSELGRATGRSLSRVSHTLAALRLAGVVRYGTDGKLRVRYRLKHLRETWHVLKSLGGFINSVSPLSEDSCVVAQLRNYATSDIGNSQLGYQEGQSPRTGRTSFLIRHGGDKKQTRT